MWDSNAPLQLLRTMPKKLGKEDLEKIQLVIDADKYKNSLISGFDLCGMYAPFCRGCKKTSIYPCAIAYVNMLQSGGADIEIDARPVAPSGKFVSPQYPVNTVAAAENAVREEAVEQAAATAYMPEVPVPAVPTVEASVHNEIYKNEVYDRSAVAESEIAAAKQTETIRQKEESSFVPEPVPVKSKIRIAVARKKI